MATVEQTLPLAPRGRTEGLPILIGFRTEILPAVALLWTGITIAFIVTREAYLWPVAVWATVTTMMLWPVGRTLGRPYFSYRTPLFVLGVLSMGYIIFTESLPPTKRDAVKKSMEAAAMQLPEGPRKIIMKTQEELMAGMGRMAMAGTGAGMTPSRKKWWEFWK